MPDGIPEYTNVQGYLSDPERGQHRFVRINNRYFSTFQLNEFNGRTSGGLTDANLITTFADVNAYLANPNSNQLYAQIGDGIYLVSVLESRRNAGTLNADNLPSPVTTDFSTTAIGDYARAKDFDSTAIGSSAYAGGRDSTAIGQYSGAFETRGLAVGANTRSYGDRSTVVGGNTLSFGRQSVVVGVDSISYGERATVVGQYGLAIGDRNSVFGRGATAANLAPGQEIEDAVSGHSGIGGLVECAREPDLNDAESFVSGCSSYLTDAERGDVRLAAETDAGETFRADIRTRLQARLTALEVGRATALGYAARATEDRATAVGQYAQAIGVDSTAVGTTSIASGASSTAVGVFSWVTGDHSTAVGRYAQALGEHGAAFGRHANAGGLSSDWIYNDAEEYFADNDRTRHTNVIIAGKVFATSALEAFPNYADAAAYLAATRASDVTHAVIAGKLYAVADLDAVTSLTDTNLPGEIYQPPNPLSGAARTLAAGANSFAGGEDSTALGANARAEAGDSTAVGQNAQAIADRATAVGANAQAKAERATAVGAQARAGERSAAVGQRAIATGTRSSAFGRQSYAADRSTATGHYAFAPAARSDAYGNSALALGEHSVALGGSSRAGGLGSIYYNYDSVADYLADTERAADIRDNFPDDNLVVIAGNVYEISALDAVTGLTEANLPAPIIGATDTTAVGNAAHATGDESTAVGQSAQASGQDSAAFGADSIASEYESTAVGTSSWATGESAAAFGFDAEAHAEDSAAFGTGSLAGGTSAGKQYDDAEAYFADATRLDTDGNPVFTHVIIGGKLYTTAALEALPKYTNAASYLANTPPRGDNTHVVINGKLYAVDDLQAVAGLTDANLPGEIDQPPSPFTAPGAGALAIGTESRADGVNSIALGKGAHAAGNNAIAIGAGVRAAANQVVIGNNAHTYILPGLAATQTTRPEVVTVDENGELVADGGALHQRVETLESTIAGDGTGTVDEVARTAAATAQAEVDALETSVGTADDAASETGSVFARSKAAQADADTAQTAADTAQGEVDVLETRVGTAESDIDALETSVGAASDTASDTGSAFARAKAAQADADTAQGEVDALETTVSGHAGRISALENAPPGEGTDSTARAAAAAAQADADTAQGEVDALETRVGTAESDIDALETSVGAASDVASETGSAFARAKAAQADADTAQGEVDALETRVGTAENNIDALETSVGAAGDAASETGSAFARAKAAQADADAAQTAADTTQSEVDALETTVSGHTGRISALENAPPGEGTDSTARAAAAVAQGEVDALETQVGTADDAANEDGSAFARVKAAQADADAAQAAADTAQGEVDALETSVGTSSDAASETGSVYARTAQAQADATAARTAAGNVGDTASATGSAHARITDLRAAWTAAADDPATAAAAAVSTANQAITAAGEIENDDYETVAMQAVQQVENPDDDVAPADQRFESVTISVGAGSQRVVLKLKGGATEQIATLVALLSRQPAPGDPVTGANGNPVGTTYTEFSQLDHETNGATPTMRLAYLFESLYGNPRNGIIDTPEADSYRPDEDSIFGRHQRGILRSAQDVALLGDGFTNSAGTRVTITNEQKEDLTRTTQGYRRAPDIHPTNDLTAPRTNEDRRVVVQDTNKDGTIILRTIENTALSGRDPRVDVLSKELKQSAASSAALTALPNTVPGDGNFYLGLGLGNYRSESAIAIGVSGRMELQSGRSFFANAGVSSALSNDSSASSRVGVGWSW